MSACKARTEVVVQNIPEWGRSDKTSGSRNLAMILWTQSGRWGYSCGENLSKKHSRTVDEKLLRSWEKQRLSNLGWVLSLHNTRWAIRVEDTVRKKAATPCGPPSCLQGCKQPAVKRSWRSNWLIIAEVSEQTLSARQSKSSRLLLSWTASMVVDTSRFLIHGTLENPMWQEAVL